MGILSGASDAQCRTLIDPLDAAQKRECGWYLEKYLGKKPYSTTRARKAAEMLKGYARDLLSQLKLNELIPAAGNDVLELEIAEAQLDDSTSRNTIHQLYWELLEEPSVWDRNDLEIRIHRSSRSNGSPSADIKGVQLWHARMHSQPSLNILLVIARDMRKQKNQYNDVHPWVISNILTKIQRDFVVSGTCVSINLEIVRPGTLKSLEEHLARSEELHGRGYFHIVHFDMHGKVGEIKGKGRESEAAYLRFCDPESDGTKAIRAQDVGEILRRHYVPMVILNACESARANSGDDMNIAKILSREGVQNILALSFETSEAAVQMFFRSFYWNFIVKRLDFSTAASKAREVLRESPSRCARFNLTRRLIDWFVPVVYNSGPPLSLVSDEEVDDRSTASYQHTQPEINMVVDLDLIGRDFDILRIEKRLLAMKPGESQVGTAHALYLYGEPGVGKSALLKYTGSLWTNSSFVDAAIYIDFESHRITSIEDFISEILAQLPSRPELTADPHSAIALHGISSDLVANEELNKAIMLLAKLNIALILDGLQLLTVPSFPAGTAQYPSPSVIKGINEVLRIMSNLHVECPRRLGPFFIFASRHETPPSQISHCVNVATYELSPLEPHDSETLVRTLLSDPTSSPDYLDATSADIQKSEPLAGLLQRIPAALVHFANLSRTSFYSMRELYDLLHAGHTQEWLEAGYDGKSNKIFMELKRVFTTIPTTILSPMLMIGWYWHEGPSTKSFTNALISAKVCKVASDVANALQLATEWAYIRVGNNNEIEWIHPLFTIACRIFTCAMLELPSNNPSASWQSFRKAFGCNIMGHQNALSFDDCRLNVESAEGLQATVLLLTSALSANPMRDVNLQFFTFAGNFLRDVNMQRVETFATIFGGVTLPNGTSRTSNNSLWTSLECGFQNALFAIQICLGRGAVCLPSSLWPQLCLNLYGGAFVKIGSIVQIRLLAENFERLLGRLLQSNYLQRGKPSFKPDELSLPLSLALSVSWMHRHIPSLTKNYQRYMEWAWKILEMSEAEFGDSTDTIVLVLKSFMSKQKAETLIHDGHALEADEAFKAGLSFGRRAIGQEKVGETTHLARTTGPHSELQDKGSAFLGSYLQELEDSWNLYKDYARGENITEAQYKTKISQPREEDENDEIRRALKIERTTDKVIRHHLLERKLSDLEFAGNSSGNWGTALQHHQDFVRSAIEKSDLAEAREHIGTMRTILEREQPTSDKIRTLQIVQDSLLNENSIFGQIMTSDATANNLPRSTHEYLESVAETEKSMRKAGVSQDAIRHLEVFRESIAIGDQLNGISDDEPLVIPIEEKKRVQTLIAKHLSKCVLNESHGKQMNALLLELQTILRDLDIADINYDLEGSLRLLARMDKISLDDEFSDLVDKEYVKDRRLRVFQRNLPHILKHFTTEAKKTSDLLEGRIAFQNCIGHLERYSLTGHFSSVFDVGDLVLLTEQKHLYAFADESKEAVDSSNYSRALELFRELSALNEAGSFIHIPTDFLQTCLDIIRPLELYSELKLALINGREKDTITCCKEWESSDRWERVMKSPIKNSILYLRDYCATFYYLSELCNAAASVELSEAFDHLDKLEVLCKRQQSLEEFADEGFPKLIKSALPNISNLLHMEARMLVHSGKEAVWQCFSGRLQDFAEKLRRGEESNNKGGNYLEQEQVHF